MLNLNNKEKHQMLIGITLMRIYLHYTSGTGKETIRAIIESELRDNLMADASPIPDEAWGTFTDSLIEGAGFVFKQAIDAYIEAFVPKAYQLAKIISGQN